MSVGTSFAQSYLIEVVEIASAISADVVDRMVAGIASMRDENGKLLVLGVGGGAAHASHAVCDFRKLCGIDARTPVDNVAELTARANDDGWESTFSGWLEDTGLTSRDAVLVFSVGGGSRDPAVSANIVAAVDLAKERGARVYAVVGKWDGAAARAADEAVVIDAPAQRRTPHVEGFQAVIWHLLVWHPDLQRRPGKWESLEPPVGSGG